MNPSKEKQRAFLDTSVLVALTRGNSDAQRLFSEEVVERVTFVVSPIVLQELLILDSGWPSEALAEKLEIVPNDVLMDAESLDRLRSLRNRIVHSNDALIIAAANSAHCDWLVTMDRDLVAASRQIGLKTLSPAELLSELRA